MTYVRDFMARRLVCCWDDCDRDAHDEISVPDKGSHGQTVWMIFCSERCRDYWVHSPRGNGRLPAGDRRLWRYR